MGLFDGKPKTTKYRVIGRVASYIEGVIDHAGIEYLGVRSIALDRNFNIRLGGGTDSRGGDFLAAVQPNGLKGFAELQELLSIGDEGLRRLTMETMGSMIVDEMAWAVGAEFERQSPEFSRLDSGGPFDI